MWVPYSFLYKSPSFQGIVFTSSVVPILARKQLSPLRYPFIPSALTPSLWTLPRTSQLLSHLPSSMPTSVRFTFLISPQITETCKTRTNPRNHFIYEAKQTPGDVSWQRQISELLFLKFPCVYIYYYFTVIYHNKSITSILTMENWNWGPRGEW